MSNISHTIRRFNRFELKYLITLREAERFKTALRAYLIDDEHGSGNGSYALTSLYYDSPDFRCYWEKVDGIKFRRKLRIRRYETEAPLTADTPVFIEIKQRLDRVTQKRRVILPYRDALLLCN
jgi:SPX domain protein involved in polyphosphate accumulation